MCTLYLTQGPSGSGKSTFVQGKAAPWDTYCSADEFFVGPGGIYRFDAGRLGDAHRYCQWQAIRAMRLYTRNVWVDNTNTTLKELEPYIQAARNYGYRVVLYVFGAGISIETLAKRNRHGVPIETIACQVERLRDFWQSHKDPTQLGIDEVVVVPAWG